MQGVEPRSIFVKDPAGTIRSTIIHCDDLKRILGLLVQKRIKTLRYIFFDIITRNDYR